MIYIFLGNDEYVICESMLDLPEKEEGWAVAGRIKDKQIQPLCQECFGEGCSDCDGIGFYEEPRLENVIEIIEDFKERTGITQFEE